MKIFLIVCCSVLLTLCVCIVSAGSYTASSDSSLASGYYNFDTFIINVGVTVTCKGNTAINTGVVITCTDVIIYGKLSAETEGYTTNQGPGAPGMGTGHGGSYGGFGDGGAGVTYGSIKYPTDIGSGGYQWDYASIGGGSIALIATNELKVDGTISANGGPLWVINNHSGGSGGSILINAKTLSGSGQITANGGIAMGVGSGGGGRIAIYYETNSFTGAISARRGNGPLTYTRGGCGTIFMKKANQPNGDLILDGDSTQASVSYTPVSGIQTFDTIIIRNQGNVDFTSGSSITTTNFTSDSTVNIVGYNGGGFIVSNGGMNITYGDFVVENFTLEVKTTYLYLNNLRIKPGGKLTHKANTNSKLYTLNIFTNNDLTVDSGGLIDVSGKGYGAGYGPGYSGSGGGSHGGKGGGSLAPAYGSETAPVELGSGGVATPGGGAIYALVYGSLTNNGAIRADGQKDYGTGTGTGSGGSVYIKAVNFNGSAIVSAHGGDNAGGWPTTGAGGRIAVYYNSYGYTGTYDTQGGLNAVTRGETGTLYVAYKTFHLVPNNVSIENPAYSSPIPGKRPTFKWSAPTDDENDTLHFEIEISQDSAFATNTVLASSGSSQTGFKYSYDNGVNWTDYPAGGVSSNANPAVKVSYTVQQDLWVGNWYFRVRAKDVDGYSNWSQTGLLPSIIGDLVVRITSPQDSSAVYDEKVKVEGVIEQSIIQSASINGISQNLTLTENKFSLDVNLNLGKNVVVVTANGALGNYLSDTVTIYRLKVPMSESSATIGKDGGSVRLDDYDDYASNDAKVEVGQGVFEKDVSIKFKKLEGDYPIYEIKINNKESYRLKNKIRIVLSYKDMKVNADDEDRLSVFYSDGVKWHPIGSEVDKNNKLVSCYTNHASKYAVMVLPGGKETTVSVVPNIFTPNSDGVNDLVTFNFVVTSGTRIEVSIYNSEGKTIRSISEENVVPGISINWDGLDSSGKLVETGVYYYTASLSGKTISSGIIVVAK